MNDSNDETQKDNPIRKAREYMQDALWYACDALTAATSGQDQTECGDALTDLKSIEGHATNLIAIIRETQNLLIDSGTERFRESIEAELVPGLRASRDAFKEDLEAVGKERDALAVQVETLRAELERVRDERDRAANGRPKPNGKSASTGKVARA